MRLVGFLGGGGLGFHLAGRHDLEPLAAAGIVLALGLIVATLGAISAEIAALRQHLEERAAREDLQRVQRRAGVGFTLTATDEASPGLEAVAGEASREGPGRD